MQVALKDRIKGAVLGGAIGDAMGHPVEFHSMDRIQKDYGPAGVQDFELFWERDGRTFAPYTDDTQMSECVARALVDEPADLEAAMVNLAKRFVHWSVAPQGGHRAPGGACLAGCRALAQGAPWREAGGPQAGGCGSVMRAWPVGLVFSHNLAKAEEWAVAQSLLTHRDPIALAACAALAVGVALLVQGELPPRIVVQNMAYTAEKYDSKTAAMIWLAYDEALNGTGPEITLDRLRAWAAHEAIAAAVYVFLRHADNPRAGILEGANTPGDSDSIASIAGVLLGAYAGADALPRSWRLLVERSTELHALAESLHETACQAVETVSE